MWYKNKNTIDPVKSKLMIWYRSNDIKDPYEELWSRDEWLKPFETKPKFPLVITVEPTNRCQNNCLYCSRQLMDREYGYLDLGIMDKISIEAAKHNAAVRHGGFGEPLLHPEIIPIVKSSKSRNVLTTIFTNGNRLTKEIMESFVELGLDEIRFSSSGITSGEHNRIRKRSNYESDFMQKIAMARSVKEKMGSEKPFLTLYTNVMDYDDANFRKELNAYIEKYLEYADKIDIDLTMFSRVKDLDHVKPLYAGQTINEQYKKCATLFLKIIIHWNGDVFACDIPYNFEEDFFLGNMADPDFTIKKGFNSEKINLLRENLSFNMNHKKYGICSKCFINGPKWDFTNADSDS